jgi:membrane protease YdiL (CAAX protease family)
MDPNPQPHTLWQTLGLHLIPGALITAFFYLFTPSFVSAGYPPVMTLYLAICFILIPFELGVLYYQGRKLNGRFSLQGIVLNRQRLPIWQYFVFVLVLFIWCAAIFSLLPPLDNYFIQNLFAWLPAWALPANMLGDTTHYARSAMLVTFLVGLVFNGILGPVVEELYFRGYLLPRLPASRAWAPLFNVLLFSLYHFFSPWQNITRILALIPLVYAVSWKRNIYIGMLTHCLLNTLSMLGGLLLMLR